jgi:hypothetical protein
MPAVNKSLYIEQGATFKLGFAKVRESETTEGTPGEPYDFTGCTARMQIRRSLSTPVLVEATTENGKIVITGLEGHVRVVLEDEDTDLLVTRTGVYDLEIEYPSGEVDRLLEGKVVVSPNVTREEA